jgi:hypothetical protein
VLKFCLTIFSFIAAFSGAASAQILTQEQLAACKPDFEKYCGGKIPDANTRVIGCFAAPDMWSDACKKAMEDSERKRREERAGTKN